MCKIKIKIIKKLTIVVLLINLSYGAKISILPQESIIDNGSSFELNIEVSELRGEILSGFEMDINYDTAVISFVNYTITDVLGNISDGNVIDLSSGDNGYGLINISALSIGNEFLPQLEPFIIARINMKAVKGEETTKFSIIDPLLLNYYGEMIEVDDVNEAVVKTVPEPGVLTYLLLNLTFIVIFLILKEYNPFFLTHISLKKGMFIIKRES